MRTDITALELKPGDGVVTVGSAVQLNLFALKGGGRMDLIPGAMATWSSSDGRIAEVNRQGRLIPREAGSVTITATYAGQKAQGAFTVVT